MKRDLDLMRTILLEAEASDSDTFKGCGDSDSEKIQAHTHWLEDLGFITKYMEERKDNVYRLTNGGHDFIVLSRNDETWEKAKAEGLGDMRIMQALLVKWKYAHLKEIL